MECFILHPHTLSSSSSSSSQALILRWSSFSITFLQPKMNSSNSTSINVPETKAEAKGKAPLIAAPIVATTITKATRHPNAGWKKGIAVFDFLLRLVALASTLAAAIIMGTTDETLPFFTQYFQFQASFDDLPAFLFFVVAMAIASGYLVLSLPFSLAAIFRPTARRIKLLLMICDTVMLAFTTAGAASATAIVYLAHNGSSSANWIAICQQFTDFCQSVSGAVVASFVAVVLFMLLVMMSALALRKN